MVSEYCVIKKQSKLIDHNAKSCLCFLKFYKSDYLLDQSQGNTSQHIFGYEL